MRGHAHVLGVYSPGSSPVHLAPAWLKYLVLLSLPGLALALADARVTAACLLAALACYALAGRSILASVLLPLRGLWLIFVILGAHQWWLNGVVFAAVVLGNILLCMLLARLLMLTTPGPVLLDNLVGAARPFTRLGANPERFGLAVSLMLRSIPYLVGSVRDVRESAKARGLERNPRALFLPVVVNAVAYAHQTGDALTARGLGDDD